MDTPTCTVPLEAQPLDCAVSPVSGLLAAALVTGQLQFASFSCPPHTQSGGSQLAYQLLLTVPPPPQPYTAHPQPSKKKQKKDAAAAAGAADPTSADAAAPSCRAVNFTTSGDAVLAGYSDRVVRSYDVVTGRAVATFSGEHNAPLSRVFAVAPHVFASGDEEGLVALWDMRVSGGGGSATYRYTAHTDYITDFALHAKSQALVVTSGDATLSIHDLRKGKAVARSEDDNDDELLSCAVMKGGRKVVAGTQSGVLHLYSWGYFNDCSDRFPGHPESVQALAAFDDDTLLTGSSDGGVRIVGLLPNRLLGILGQHHLDFPVERIALSSDGRVLASMSHDSAVKLWDLAVLHDDGDDDDGEDEGEEGEGQEDDGDVGGDLASAAAAAVTTASGRRRFGEEGCDAAERAKRRALREEEEGVDPDDEGEDESEEGEGEDDSEGDEDVGTEGSEGDEDVEAEGSEGDSGDSGGEADEDERVESEGGNETGGAKAGREQQQQQQQGSRKGRTATGPTAAREKAAAAAAVAAAGKPAAAARGGAGGDSDGSDDSDDSDGGGGRGSKPGRKPLRERTKWTRGAEQKKRPVANFFADLL